MTCLEESRPLFNVRALFRRFCVNFSLVCRCTTGSTTAFFVVYLELLRHPVFSFVTMPEKPFLPAKLRVSALKTRSRRIGRARQSPHYPCRRRSRLVCRTLNHGRFDLQLQSGATNIAPQPDHPILRPQQSLRKSCPRSRQIFSVPEINFKMPLGHTVRTKARAHLARLRNQPQIVHRAIDLPQQRIRRHRLVSLDRRRARHEGPSPPVSLHLHCARKTRRTRPVLRRILVSRHLLGILHRLWARPRRREHHRDRALRTSHSRSRRRRSAPTCTFKCVSPSDAKFPIPFHLVRCDRVDPGNIIPYPRHFSFSRSAKRQQIRINCLCLRAVPAPSPLQSDTHQQVPRFEQLESRHPASLCQPDKQGLIRKTAQHRHGQTQASARFEPSSETQ